MKIQINNYLFEQTDLKEKTVQLQIRYLYDHKEVRTANCLCNNNKNPLIITYHRTSNSFALRKPPNQTNTHEKNCRYAKQYLHQQSQSLPNNNFTLSLSFKEQKGITDNENLKRLFNYIQLKLDENNEPLENVNWKGIESSIQKIAEITQLNNAPLNNLIEVIRPKKFEEIKTLELTETKIILATIYKTLEIKSTGDLMFFIKGIENPVYLSAYKKDKALSEFKMGAIPKNETTFIFFTGKTFGKNIQASSLLLFRV